MIVWPDLHFPPINLYNVWHLQARVEERNDKWRENYLRHNRTLYSDKTGLLNSLYKQRNNNAT